MNSMNLQELLEKDRERIIASLSQAKTTDHAIPIIESEYDRLLYQYNEECESDYQRRCAAMILRTARMGVPMIDCVKETKIWQHSSPSVKDEKRSNKMLPAILLAVSLILCVFAVIVLAGVQQSADKIMETPAIAIVLILGMIGLVFSGVLFSRKPKSVTSENEFHAENRIDAEKIYHIMRQVTLIADQNIQEALSSQLLEQRESASENAHFSDSNDLSLYSDLLEAQRSKNSEYAMDQLSKLPFYLHQKGIEMVEYSDENRFWFDVIPGEKKETIRPALVQDGILLKKGIVSGY